MLGSQSNMKMLQQKYCKKLGARLIGVRDVLGASVLLRNILKSKYYWEVGSIDKYVFRGSIYIGENDDTL